MPVLTEAMRSTMWSCLRWPLLVLGLGVLYHVAVGQPKHARFGLVTPSALAATLLWLDRVGLFRRCARPNFASYSSTYGSLRDRGADGPRSTVSARPTQRAS